MGDGALPYLPSCATRGRNYTTDDNITRSVLTQTQCTTFGNGNLTRIETIWNGKLALSEIKQNMSDLAPKISVYTENEYWPCIRTCLF